MRTSPTLSLLIPILLLPASLRVNAQEQRVDVVDDPAVVEARALLQAGRKQIIRDEILFTRDEAPAFWEAYERYRSDIMAVRDRQAALIADYVQAYRAAAVTEQMANALVDDYLDIKADILKIQRKHLKRFHKIVSPLKVARFFQLENKLDAETDAQLAVFVPLIDPV